MRGVLLAGALVLAGPAAEAAEWQVDPERTKIGFEYLRDGKPANGIFDEFEGEGTFDPANPAAAVMELRIESSSIDLFDFMASGFATSAEWFDSKNHPHVTYQLARLTPVAGDDYEAYGVLTIRGQSQHITTPLTLSIDAATAHATGRITVDRTHFLLGVGPSAAFVEIGPEVTVSFDLVAVPAQ